MVNKLVILEAVDKSATRVLLAGFSAGSVVIGCGGMGRCVRWSVDFERVADTSSTEERTEAQVKTNASDGSS